MKILKIICTIFAGFWIRIICKFSSRIYTKFYNSGDWKIYLVIDLIGIDLFMDKFAVYGKQILESKKIQ